MKQVTDMKTNKWTQKQTKNIRKSTLPVVNAGSRDPDYLYYPLNVECVTQKGSLLPSNII